jgi:hypothetical protein
MEFSKPLSKHRHRRSGRRSERPKGANGVDGGGDGGVCGRLNLHKTPEMALSASAAAKHGEMSNPT